jgi:hypothetical protein
MFSNMVYDKDFLYSDLIVFDKIQQISVYCIKNDINFIHNHPGIIFPNAVWGLSREYKRKLHNMFSHFNVDVYYYNLNIDTELKVESKQIGDLYEAYLL